jgi:hypothetical protein
MFDPIPADKAKHFLYGSVAAVLGAIVAAKIHYPAEVVAFLFALTLGFGKEIYDKVTGKGVPDMWDVAATTAGCLPIAVVTIIHRFSGTI